MAHVCLLKMDIASQLRVSNSASPTPLAQEGAEQETSAVASEHILEAGPAFDVLAAAAARCRSIWRTRVSRNRGKFGDCSNEFNSCCISGQAHLMLRVSPLPGPRRWILGGGLTSVG